MGDRYHVTGSYYSIESKDGTKSPYYCLSEMDARELDSSLGKGFVVFKGAPYRITCWTSESSHYVEEDMRDMEVYYDLVSITPEEYSQEVGDFKELYLEETDIVIKEHVKQIAENSFSNRKELRSIVIPDSVETIGKFAFYGCSGLETIVIPDSVTRIQEGAFAYCSSLKNIVLSKSLKSIETSVFHRCTSLTNIVIPESVTIIGVNAFSYSGLTCIKLPESITEIWGNAFSYCEALESVSLPSSLLRIGFQVFTGCSSLTSIEIPASVSSIDENAFYQCPELKHIKVSDQNDFYDSRNDCNAIIITKINCLIIGCEGTVIPDSVSKIGPGALKNLTSLTSIVIPDSVREIDWYAFGNCINLRSVVIPDSVEKINGSAFDDCSNLTSIVVSKGNKVYDSRNNCNAIFHTKTNCLIVGCKNTVIPDSVGEIAVGTFRNRTDLRSVVIPDSVSKIDSCAFENCTNLTSVILPASVSEIGYKAFSGCTALTSIVISDSLNEIGNCAFENCKNLKQILIGRDNPDGPKNAVSRFGHGIHINAFKGCNALENLEIPSSMTHVDGVAFRDCSNLTSIVVSKGNKEYDSRDNCNAIIHTETNCLIVGCMNTVIPDSVSKIDRSAFINRTNLTSIVIPDSVREIDSNAFENCTNLRDLVIPDSVTEIGYNAFKEVPIVFYHGKAKGSPWGARLLEN